MTTLRNTISHRTGESTFASCTSSGTGQSLQKSFHLSLAAKIELKKISSPSEYKKYETAQTNTTQTMTVKLNNYNGLQTRWTRTPAGNSVLPQLAVTCKIEAECSYQTFVQVDSKVLRNRQLRQHANRYASL
ncbi:MAG: hypothetical protein HJHJAOHD_02170 [Flavobacteriales bacterium]|nr:hypothetical protein [Flavobacteriales bacterium]